MPLDSDDHATDTTHFIFTDSASQQRAVNKLAIRLAGWGRLSASLDIQAQTSMHFHTPIVCAVGWFRRGMVQDCDLCRRYGMARRCMHVS